MSYRFTVFYSSRCRCFKTQKSCTSECSCIGCSNLYGSRRSQHEPDKNTACKLKFLTQQRREDLSKANWSTFENLVIHEILSENTLLDIDSITKIYDDIVFYSNAAYCLTTLPDEVVFRGKTEHQVESKINYIHSRYTVPFNWRH